jgi:hypothetical protein
LINQRDKGKRYERAIAKKLNKFLDANVKRTPNSGGLSLKGDILTLDTKSPAFPYHWELKNQKSVHIPKWWKQTIDDCPVSKIPLLVYRMNYDDMISMRLDDFIGLLIELNSEDE